MPTTMKEAVHQLSLMSIEEPSGGPNRSVYCDPKRIARVKAIGEMLGDYSNMQTAANWVRDVISNKGDMRGLDLAWDGIHGWMY